MPAPSTNAVSRSCSNEEMSTPMCVDSAMSGPASANARPAGASATRGASTARNARTSRSNDEQDRAQDCDGFGAHRRRLLIDEDRQ